MSFDSLIIQAISSKASLLNSMSWLQIISEAKVEWSWRSDQIDDFNNMVII